MPPSTLDQMQSTAIRYQQEQDLSVEAFIDVLKRSGLGERRPIEDKKRIEAMLTHANAIITARTTDGLLVGVARALSDFSYCCYLSDLAVDKQFQRQGIGKALIRHLSQLIGPDTQLLLLAAPAAKQYYGHIGFRYVRNAWSLDRGLAP